MELLDRKRQLLQRELDRLAERREETRRAWIAACEEAERWALRAAVLGGSTAMTHAASPVAGQGTVAVPWRNTMGVSHPDDPHCTLPLLGATAAAAGNSAIAPAAAAFRRALEAGVAHSAADSSFVLLDRELSATRRRLRAIERHRVPVLEEALGRLELRLDELEREERVVTRWAQRRLHGELGGPAA
jgi:V/A-type H+-transporting ATPase subunit D